MLLKVFIAIFLSIKCASFAEGINITANETSPKEEKLILVTGCGRSGTGYMCKFLKASGVLVLHEYMGKQGSVSWLMGAEVDKAPWGPLSKNYKFKHIFHQVRDPVKVIQSFYNVPPLATWEWIQNILPQIKDTDPLLTKCAKYWIYWNKMVEEKAEWTYRIEDFDTDYVEMAKRLDLKFDKKVLSQIGKKNNTKGPPTRVITWEILKGELDTDTYHHLRKLARHYGYLPVE